MIFIIKKLLYGENHSGQKLYAWQTFIELIFGMVYN